MRELLLVEDQASEAALARHALQASGAQLSMATVDSGPAGLQWLADRVARGSDPATVLVLMDLNMPGMDGLATLERIRRDPALSTTPVLMLSNSSDEKDLQRSNGAGADGYIWKPLSFPDLCKFFNNLDDFWFDHIAAGKDDATEV